MPVQLPPISRRRFLAGSLAASSGLILPGQLFAADVAVDANRFALLADTHIFKEADKIARGVNMTANLSQARDEVLALAPRPAAVMVAGDCTFSQGEAGSYAQLAKLVAPFRQAALPVHFCLGNHDNHERFWAAFPESTKAEARPVAGKHITVLETPRANWFLLDSLHKTGFIPGRLGKAQLDWLAKTLDAHADKPALLMAHHYPEKGGQGNGLQDTDALFDLIVPRKQVKAYFFGHSHRWALAKHEGIHLVNLPATAYVFANTEPSGWVDTRLHAGGTTLTLTAIDKKHPTHGKTFELKWRA